MTNTYDKSGVLGGNYDSAAMDFEAAHQALLAEARKLGYREGFEAGRAYEREEAEGESYEKELSKLAKYASVMGKTTSNVTRESEASEALNEAYKSGPIESAVKETREFIQQARRDEIVEQAEDDFINTAYDYQLSADDSEIVVNRGKRTVVALSKNPITGKVLSRGIAKCAQGDCFNVHIGKAIALRRALGLPVPDEYINAPQPTEVRVGDVIGFPFDPKDNGRHTVTHVGEATAYLEDGEFCYEDALFDVNELEPECDPYIIDDSREEVGE
ncbi:hypothetical protein [Shouchella clausii]|uniref:hypothetical protein n=1 Tax=Shouchella clausii TaxID=79880 RepID=UPI0016533759|nr:hypothetical protein [Shouchella clausii]QNM43700.1 hypothetical protein DUT88_12705 [Shouchella clausii]